MSIKIKTSIVPPIHYGVEIAFQILILELVIFGFCLACAIEKWTKPTFLGLLEAKICEKTKHTFFSQNPRTKLFSNQVIYWVLQWCSLFSWQVYDYYLVFLGVKRLHLGYRAIQEFKVFHVVLDIIKRWGKDIVLVPRGLFVYYIKALA